MRQISNNFKPYLAYSASAGSGKTFALSVRYVSLLFMGESPSHILAATFTNKAASEMKLRVIESLKYFGDSVPFLEAVSYQTGMSCEKLISLRREVLDRFLSSSSHIVTLDSFFSSILRSASLEIGLEPDFVTKEQSDEHLESYFLDEVKLDSRLHSLVRLAIDIEDRRFGKIFQLMEDFYKIDALLPEIEEPIESVADVTARCEATRAKILTALESASAPARCIAQFTTPTIKELSQKKLFEKTTLAEHSWFKKIVNDEIEGLYAFLKQELALWADTVEATLLRDLFVIYSYYKNANIRTARMSGVLTFDDLTYFTHRLLYEAIDREFLYFKLDSKFKHILLDEFQDTSTLQFLLLKPLIDELFSGDGQSDFRSFFYVGDTKQSLYRFRGGVEELFDQIAQNYGISIENMDTNYRSSQSVVEQINRWFEPIMQGYVPQKSHRGASVGFVEVLESEELVDEAIIQIKSLLDMGVDVDDIAILVHTNKDGQAIQQACQESSIPTLLKTSSSLKNSPKVASLMAMLSYLYYGDKIDAYPILERLDISLESIDTSWFAPLKSPLSMLHKLIDEFGYFDSDVNILRVLEFASSFSDISTLLEEFALSNISVASGTVHGIKIMTIHGSKGLEFEYVILLDKFTRPNSDRSPLLLHYDENLFVDRILYRRAGRENYDNRYAQVLSQRANSSQKDRQNILYVALTRAVEGMVVIRKPKGSVFDEIEMHTTLVGERVYRPHTVSDVPTVIDTLPTDIHHYGVQSITRAESIDDKDYDAILFGTALHYALEMLSSFETHSIADAIMAVKNRYGLELSSDMLDEIKARVEMLIDSIEFQSLLKGATISKEQSISYQGEVKQIDLLLEYEDSYMVIDYKSSQKFAIKHQQQVALYKKAISQITGKLTDAKIVYILHDRVLIS